MSLSYCVKYNQYAYHANTKGSGACLQESAETIYVHRLILETFHTFIAITIIGTMYVASLKIHINHSAKLCACPLDYYNA